MVDESGYELKDYKYYCFDGKVKIIMINSDRMSSKETRANYFDENYQPLDFVWGYENAKIPPTKPEKFEEMKCLAEKLSEGIYDSKNIIHWPFKNFIKQIVVDIITIVLMSSTVFVAPVKYYFTLSSISYVSWFFLAIKISIVSIVFICIVNLICYKKYMIKLYNALTSIKKNVRY